MMPIRDLSGQVFGRLTVTVQHERRRYAVYWMCLCSCGNVCWKSGRLLIVGKTRSCGCYRVACGASLKASHGMRGLPEYSVWSTMKKRCFNVNNKKYPAYGGRGITVCDQWKASFPNFFLDMGPRPSSGHSIDRINNNGNYEPGNCRWATPREQTNNRRPWAEWTKPKNKLTQVEQLGKITS